MKLLNRIIRHFDRVASLGMHGEQDSVMLYLPAGEDARAYFFYRGRPLRGDLSRAVTSLHEPDAPAWFSNIREVEFIPVSSEYAEFPFTPEETDRDYLKSLSKWMRRMARAVTQGDGDLSADQVREILDRKYRGDTGACDLGALYLQIRARFPDTDDEDDTLSSELVPSEDLRRLVREYVGAVFAPAEEGTAPLGNVYVSRNFITLQDLGDDDLIARLATQAGAYLSGEESYSLGLDVQTFQPICGAMDFLLPVFIRYDLPRVAETDAVGMENLAQMTNRAREHRDEFVHALLPVLPRMAGDAPLELVSPDFVTDWAALARFRLDVEEGTRKVRYDPENKEKS